MTLFQAVVYILLVCGAVALVYWAVPQMRTPEPLARIVQVLAMIIGIVVVVWIVLQMIGMGGSMGTLPPAS